MMIRLYYLLIVLIISLNKDVECLITYEILNSTKCSNYCNSTNGANVQEEIILKAYPKTNKSYEVSNVTLEVWKPNSNSSEKICFLNGCRQSKDFSCYCKNSTSDFYNSTLVLVANVNVSCLYSQAQIILIVMFDDDSRSYREQTTLPDFSSGDGEPNITTSLLVNGNVVEESNCTVEVPHTQVTIEYLCSSPTVTPCYLELVDLTRNITIKSSKNGGLRLKHNYRENSYVRFLLQKKECETRQETEQIFECLVRTGSNWEEDLYNLKATFLLILIGTVILITAGLCQYRHKLLHRLKDYKLVNQVPNRPYS